MKKDEYIWVSDGYLRALMWSVVVGSMFFVCSLGLILFIGSAEAQAQARPSAQTPIRKGDKVELVSNQYVRVVNPGKVVHKRGRAVQYGDKCFASAGGSVAVVGTRGDHVLLRYGVPPEDSGDCPGGTLFFMSQKNYRKMLREIAAHNARIQAEKDVVKRLLKKEKMLPIKKSL